MARPALNHPTGTELEILKVLWEVSPLSVREIRERLADAGRDNAHTSVITMLNIMVRKGYLQRRKENNSYRFWPKVSGQQVSGEMLDDMVERVFGGSASSLMLNLLGNSELERDELMSLRKMINQKVAEQKSATPKKRSER